MEHRELMSSPTFTLLGAQVQTLHFLMGNGESGESVQNLRGVSHYEHFAAICKAAALF